MAVVAVGKELPPVSLPEAVPHVRRQVPVQGGGAKVGELEKPDVGAKGLEGGPVVAVPKSSLALEESLGELLPTHRGAELLHRQVSARQSVLHA